MPSLLALAAGTIFFVQLSCYLEEWIFKQLPGFNFHWTVALVELLFFTLLSRAALPRSMAPRSGPLTLYMGVGVSLAAGTGLGKVAFKYVDYVTGTVLKSMKLLPVLLLSACWLHRRFYAQEIVAALLMVCAAALFGLGEKWRESSSFESHGGDFLLGLALSVCCLLSQALQNNLQDRLLRDYGADVHEAVVFSNGFGFCCVLVLTLCTGELPVACAYFSRSGALPPLLLLLRSASFYVGALLYTMLLKRAGAVTAVTVGMVRKILTVLVSYLLFPKPFSAECGWGLVCMLVALTLDTQAHHQRGGPPQAQQLKQEWEWSEKDSDRDDDHVESEEGTWLTGAAQAGGRRSKPSSP